MDNPAAVIATYDSHDQAEDAIRELDRSGFEMKQLSIVGKGYRSEEHPVGFYTVADRVKTWGGVGAFWGALWGILFGPAFFWVPEIGLMGVAGPFIHVLLNALGGAAVAGGLSALGAALANIGVPKDAILKYERSVRAARYLLIARGSQEMVAQARAIIAHTAAIETDCFDLSEPQQQAS